MNPAFLKKVRLRIKELREMGALYKETKTPPVEIRLSMMLVEDEEFVGHGCLHFFEKCPMVYLVYGKELENIKNEFKKKEIEMYPHFGDYAHEWSDSGDIWKKDENGDWIISDEEITRRHKLVDEIGKESIAEYLKKAKGGI